MLKRQQAAHGATYLEPLTHFLTGACIGRAGFNRKTAHATLAAVLAAEAVDLDILWGLAGPVQELKHHRGITHTFIAVPVIAAVVVGAVWLWHRWRRSNSTRQAGDHAPPFSPTGGEKLGVRGLPPPHWGWLYFTALVAALSHILLDWTNNYGVRPFFPFNPRWYAGSFLFIAEPVLWALFFLALVIPWVLGLTDREIGVRKKPFRGRGWAIFALAGVTVVGCWRWAERAQGLMMVANAQVTSEPALRMSLEPYPVNPYRWHAIVETRDYYQTAEVNTWNPSAADAIVSDPHADVIYKPAVTPAVEAAKQTFLGRVYLDWGRWAIVRDLGQEPVVGITPPELPPGRTWTTVEFSDLRFNYSFLATGSGRRAAKQLSGSVYIVDGREEAGMAMAGREQR
jgi:inner membrane protein